MHHAVARRDEALAQGASEFAGRANMGTEQFIAALAQAGVEIVSTGSTARTIADAGVAVTNGITGAEKIVTSAGAFLTPGQKVKPELAKRP